MLKRIFKSLVYIFALIGLFLVAGYFAVKFGLTNTAGIIDKQTETFYKENIAGENIDEVKKVDTSWAKTEEWKTFSEAVKKDVPALTRVEKETAVPARLIMSLLGVEQLRLFTSEREIFKKSFAPLKILGVQSQFSWGVMGIKPDTAEAIENNLASTTSEFYPGAEYAHLLDFKTNDIGQERFSRITDEHDRYYSYLYASLYIKEIEAQWKKSGFDIKNRMEILATLYNIGFEHSVPKSQPEVGGSEIDINEVKYSFGGLAYDIYNSNELLDFFAK